MHFCSAARAVPVLADDDFGNAADLFAGGSPMGEMVPIPLFQIGRCGYWATSPAFSSRRHDEDHYRFAARRTATALPLIGIGGFSGLSRIS
jgi:hypothetical protein